ARLAAGDCPAGVVPAHVLSIARGVTRAMLYTKARVASLLILFAALLAAGAWGLLGPAAAQPPKDEPGATPPTRKKAAPQTDEDRAQAERIQVRGQVLDPEGRPIKGAKLFLADRSDQARKGRRPIATTNDAGRFEAA